MVRVVFSPLTTSQPGPVDITDLNIRVQQSPDDTAQVQDLRRFSLEGTIIDPNETIEITMMTKYSKEFLLSSSLMQEKLRLKIENIGLKYNNKQSD